MLTHGNGPQVGNLLIQNALAAKTVAPMPMDVCGAESQGQIGYMAAQTLANHLRKRKLEVPVVTIVTQVAVDPKDKAFANPSKPVGPFYSEAEAKKMMLEEGLAMREDAGRGWRRVVPSPEPREIVELEAVRDLLDGGCLVVCSGGGGVPVVRSRGALSGIDAVIDKDLAAALLAQELGADALLILTDVPKAYVHYGTPEQQALDRVTASRDARLRRRGPLQGRLHGSQGRGLPALRRRRRRERDRLADRGRSGDGRAGGHAHRAGRAGEEGDEAKRGRGREDCRPGDRRQEDGDQDGRQDATPNGRATAPARAAPTSSTSPRAGAAPSPTDGRRGGEEILMSKLIDSTPRADGFRMPGEFEPHKQIWMLWPQRPDNWRLGAKPAQRSWVDVATAISRFEPVTVGVNHDQYENAVNVLPASVRVIELSEQRRLDARLRADLRRQRQG